MISLNHISRPSLVLKNEALPTMTIHIAFSSDKKYLTCTSVTIASILHFHPHDINFYILHNSLTEADWLPLRQTIERLGKGCSLMPIDVGDTNWKGFPTTKNFPLAIYFRLNLPSLLTNIDKVIYLDGDILVTDDIQKVWDINLEDFSLAAMCIKCLNNNFQQLVGHYTFNSGFIVMNLKHIRDTNGITRLLEIANRCKDNFNLPDQEILNLTFRDEKYHLPVRWNLTKGALERQDINYKTIPEEELIEAIRNPAVIHFNNSTKPWKKVAKNKHPFAPLYLYFAKLARVPLGLRFLLFLKFTLHFVRNIYSPWCLEHLPEINKTIRRIRRGRFDPSAPKP